MAVVSESLGNPTAAPEPPGLGRWISPLLRERPEFRRFWLGQSISLLGDQVSFIALPLVAVLILHADAAQMGYLGAAALLPNLLFSLQAGAWVDRRGRRRQVMIAADLGRAVLLATIPIAYALGGLTLAQLYLVAFLSGSLSVLFYVSYNTLFVSLTPRAEFVEGNSLLNGSRAFSFVAGPSLGGALVQALKAPHALVADALSFLASALFLTRINPAEPEAAEDSDTSLRAGIGYIRGSAIIRASLGATATINFFNFAFYAIFILYATDELDVAPAQLGLVIGAAAVGGVIGSVITGRLTRRIGIGPAFILGCLLFPAPLLLVPLAGGPHALVLAMLFVAEFGAGFGVMILDISSGSIFAALIPDQVRARVSGAYMVVNFGVRPLGALSAGLLGGAIGLRPTLWIVAAGALIGFLWLLPSPVPRLRALPEPR
jgi:MFS family permease